LTMGETFGLACPRKRPIQYAPDAMCAPRRPTAALVIIGWPTTGAGSE
jgi:hypothetical protein